jgi:hypothetical protein
LSIDRHELSQLLQPTLQALQVASPAKTIAEQYIHVNVPI